MRFLLWLLLIVVSLIGTVLGFLVWLGSDVQVSGKQLGFALLLGLGGIALTLLYRDQVPERFKPSKLFAGLALFMGAGAGGLVVLALIVFVLIEAFKHP